jgi:hypothetical protein
LILGDIDRAISFKLSALSSFYLKHSGGHSADPAVLKEYCFYALFCGRDNGFEPQLTEPVKDAGLFLQNVAYHRSYKGTPTGSHDEKLRI